MIRLLLLSLISGLLAAPAAIADSPSEVATNLRDRANGSTRAWNIVESLTTEIGPRLAGTPADDKAVEWAKQLLEASVFDKVWLEPVEFPVWQRHKEVAKVVSPYPQPLHITALGYSGSTEGEITGELVAFNSLKELKEAAPESVKGKIVFVNDITPRHKSGAGYAMKVPLRYHGGRVAQEKGAIATLIRSIGTDSNRFPHTGVSLRLDNAFPMAAG